MATAPTWTLPSDAAIKAMTDGRGADLVIVAASARGIVEQAVACSRPGARILLFAQTSHQERIEVSGADVCMGERVLLGSYSASVDVQKESAELVFSGALPVKELISHRFPLSQIHQGIERALHPDDSARLLSEWEDASTEGRDLQTEWRFLQPDGGVRWVEGSAAAIRDSEGRLFGWGCCVDLTPRRPSEQRATSHLCH